MTRQDKTTLLHSHDTLMTNLAPQVAKAYRILDILKKHDDYIY